MLDVLIVGAGPSGSILAAQLATSGATIQIFDQRPRKITNWRYFPGERISAKTLLLLDKVGVELESIGQMEVNSLSLWSNEQGMSAQQFQAKAMIIERLSLDQALHRCCARKGVPVDYDAKFLSVEGRPGEWTVKYIQNGNVKFVTARFLVDSSGRAAVVARKFGAQINRADPLIAQLKHFKTSAPGMPASFSIEAVPKGWLYGVNLPNKSRILGYVTTLVEQGKSSSNSWAKAFEKSKIFNSWISELELGGKPKIFSASCGCLDVLSGPGWVAVGDSAFHCDPLEGNGILNAVVGALKLSQVIKAPSTAIEASRIAYEEWVRNAFMEHRINRKLVYQQSDLFMKDFRRKIL